MTEEDALYLSHIDEAIGRIEDYTHEGREIFLHTPLIQDAVIRNFEIIGEATKNLSDELRAENSDIRWRQIAGLRDMLIHEYAKVNLSRACRPASERVVPLILRRVTYSRISDSEALLCKGNSGQSRTRSNSALRSLNCWRTRLRLTWCR